MVRVYWREKAGSPFRKAQDGLTAGEYWLRYNESGKQRWQKVGPWDEVKKATILLERSLERQRVAKQYGVVAPTDSARLRVSDAVQQYIARKRLAGKRPATIVSYSTNLGLFKDWSPRLYIDEITGEDLLEFAAYCRKRGDADRTVANRFVDVMSFMKFCGRPKLVPKNDWPRYMERPVEAYTQAELDAFYKAAKTDKERLLLDLFIHTGFRNGEVAHLTYDDIKWEKNSLLVTPKEKWDWQPKTWECRSIRVPTKVMLALKAWRADHPDDALLFPTRDATPDEHLLRIIEELAKRAGIKTRVDVHKFRATAATRWSAKFKPQDVQQMLGHKSLLTTMRYLAATDQDSPEFVEKIEAA